MRTSPGLPASQRWHYAGVLLALVVVAGFGAARAAAQSPPAYPYPGPPAPAPKPLQVLLLTGADYPGHHWRKTTPVLVQALQEDSRAEVRVIEDPHFIDSAALARYHVVVLHYMNWRTPAPGAAARDNLEKFVRGGGGLVLVHFACGAWLDWPQFVQLAGRVWNPKLRGHDPRGTFRVEMARPEHPITKGLASFETDDELYTCLDGTVPIEVLATARSRVDQKEYPMAFVLNVGEGRVFHSPLGHDVKAFGPETLELFRRGVAWTAGLPPTLP
jgi:uncharacterized protein